MRQTLTIHLTTLHIHQPQLCSFDIPTKDEEMELPFIVYAS